MSSGYKLKIVLAGPCRTGKTTVVNFLSDAKEVSIGDSDYWPTHVVRIVEFEQKINVANTFVRVDVELWDTSGDLKFETCWPALSRDSHGVIFVFDPNEVSSAKALDDYHAGFCSGLGTHINDSNCIVLANQKSGDMRHSNAQLSSRFSRIPQLEVSVNEDGNRLRSDFNTFLSNLVIGLSDRRDQEEMNIINR